METALWTLIFMENAYIVGHLIRIAYLRKDVRLTAYVLLLWAIHKLIFVIVSLLNSTERLFIGHDFYITWAYALLAQFVATLLGIGICYLREHHG